MSRCFPFPPPGYEKKIRTEEADSSIKEKQRKHKKEKKEKEKREGKEKKDKEISKRKVKHRDKKDKDKSRTSEDKKPVGVLPNTVHNNGNEESKFVQDLARRNSNEEEARESQSVGKEVINKSKPKYVEGGSMLKERDVDTMNIGKRKFHDTDGFFYENGCRLNKIHRPVASPVSSVENGSKLGACRTPQKPVYELQGTVCNPEVKEHRMNGFIDAQEHKSRPAISSVKVKGNGEASAKKRSHSEMKYLEQILNVLKREELHEVGEDEEQEWLFGVKLSKKSKTDSSSPLDETLQVWNQALRIESADAVALPYVVPF